MTAPDLDPSAVTGEWIAISPDRRHLVFAPHVVLDFETGLTERLPAPGIAETEPGVRIHSAAFSPDGRHLAYAVGIGTRSYVLVVVDLNTLEPTVIHTGRCREYTSGRVCEGAYDPSWIDTETLVFVHHEGLPARFESGSRDDPVVINHFTVVTSKGEVILSREADVDHYQGVGSRVFRYRGGSTTDAWFEAGELRNGNYEPHEFERPPNHGWLATASKDGRYLIARGDPHWWLADLQTGQETALGTGDEFRSLKDCLWSPRERGIACLGKAEGQDALLFIPLSQEPGLFMPINNDNMNWKLFEWR